MNVVQAVRDAVSQAITTAPAAEVFVYSETQDFQRLWTAIKIDSGGSQPNKTQKPWATVIILWDGIPSREDGADGLRLQEWLTPFDWALAMSLSLANNPANCANPGFRCLILDFLPASFSLARRRFGYARAAMPWVRWYRPLSNQTLRSAVYDYGQFFEDLKLLGDVPESGDPDPLRISFPALRVRDLSEQQSRLAELAGIWAHMIGSPSDETSFDRHAISNVIGPQLLLWAMRSPDQIRRPDMQFAALVRLFCQLGLLPPEAGKSPAPWFQADSGLENSERMELVLIDDMFRTGWGEFLCAAIGVEYRHGAEAPAIIGQTEDKRVTVSAFSSADFLLKTLNKVVPRGDMRFQFETNITAPGVSEPGTAQEQRTTQILFLDLRLNAGLSLAEEARELFSPLLTLAAGYFCNRGPGFEQVEIDRLRDWLAKASDPGAHLASRRDDTYLEALALLPRLLALTDFSLPIVLFTSSGQRRIAELLKPYGNIITDFQKPRFFDYHADDIGPRARDSLQESMKKALAFCKARKLCRNLVKYSEGYAPVPRSRFRGCSHVEVYIDESGSSQMIGDRDAANPERNRFVLAGIVVGYPDENGWASLHDAMAIAGLRWWPDRENDFYLIKRQPRDECLDLPGGVIEKPLDIVQRFLECLDGQKLNAFGFCFEWSGVDSADGPDLTGADESRYRFMLSVAAELLLFDLFPRVFSNETTVSILAGTRVRRPHEFRRNQTNLAEMADRYGYYMPRGSSYVRTVAESSVQPLVIEQPAARRGVADITFPHKYARGVSLAYPRYQTDHPHERGTPCGRDCRAVKLGSTVVIEPRPDWTPTRHQHYVADLIAGRCRSKGKSGVIGDPYWRLFRSGSYDYIDGCLLKLLDAVRALDNQTPAGALLALADYEWDAAIGQGSIASIIVNRLATAVRKELRGAEFVTVAASLRGRTDGTDGREAGEERLGSILQLHFAENFGVVKDLSNQTNLKFQLSVWRGEEAPKEGDVVKFVTANNRVERVEPRKGTMSSVSGTVANISRPKT